MTAGSPLHVWVPGGGAFVANAQEAMTGDVVWVLDEGIPSVAHMLVSGTPTAEWLDGCAGLRAVVVPYAGVPTKTAVLLAARPHVALHNLHHNAAATAEMAVSLLLAVAKHVVAGHTTLRRGDWSLRYGAPVGVTLAGRRAVVLGWGTIGARVGHVLRAMDLDVVGVARSARPSEGVVAVDALDEALIGADTLVVTAPATEQTCGMVNASRLARLAPGAMVVNVARGALIDERALFEALRKGALVASGSAGG